jgi:hypothetical protein
MSLNDEMHSVEELLDTALELFMELASDNLPEQEIARFNQDVKVDPRMNVSDRIPGCMRCKPECVVYEGERCVKWIRSCTWDFDCK